MSGLIIEIQKGAIDENSSVQAQLFKMKLAASKLRLGDLANWIEDELNGYSDDIPDYRKLNAQPVAWNPFHGWIPIHAHDPQMMDVISSTRIQQSIGSIEDMLQLSREDSFKLPMPAKNVTIINNLCGTASPRMSHTIPRGTLVSVVSRVRALILEWSIEMEGSGIIGEDFSFSEIEKESARGIMQNITIGNFIGNLGSDINSGDISGQIADTAKLTDILNQIEANKDSLSKSGASSDDLHKVTGELREEIAKDKSDNKKIKKLTRALQTVLVGASGNIVAQGAISALSLL